MPTAKKLPSGSWRVRVFSHYEIKDGKKKSIYESFTSKDPSRAGKKEAERMASEWLYAKEKRAADTSIYTVVENYIKAKSGVLAPNTIRGYKSYLKNWISDIGDMSARSLDKTELQIWVSELAAAHKPKTVREIVSLVSSAYHMATGRRLTLTIPAPQRPELYTPTDDDLQKLLRHVAGTELEIAILLSAFCSLRRGEICALTKSDFRDGMVHVSKSMSRSVFGDWIMKDPKTPASDRYVPVPPKIMQLIEKKKGRIIRCHPDALSNRFKRAIKYAHLPHFRFHDLRHYYASTAHYLGVPDEYIMANGGWSSDNVMKRVYREALIDKKKLENEKISEHYNSLCDTIYDTNTRRNA